MGHNRQVIIYAFVWSPQFGVKTIHALLCLSPETLKNNISKRYPDKAMKLGQRSSEKLDTFKGFNHWQELANNTISEYSEHLTRPDDVPSISSKHEGWSCTPRIKLVGSLVEPSLTHYIKTIMFVPHRPAPTVRARSDNKRNEFRGGWHIFVS